MDVVEVEWLDAWATTASTTAKKAARNKPEVTRTIGYLVCENEEGITVATDRYPNAPGKTRIVNFIPWGIVSGYWHYV